MLRRERINYISHLRMEQKTLLALQVVQPQILVFFVPSVLPFPSQPLNCKPKFRHFSPLFIACILIANQILLNYRKCCFRTLILLHFFCFKSWTVRKHEIKVLIFTSSKSQAAGWRSIPIHFKPRIPSPRNLVLNHCAERNA